MPEDAAVPRVLTTAAIPALTQGLDAASVLECYLLQRVAPLHGLANGTVAVRKLALGLRYRPPTGGVAATASQPRHRELTLEYGPLRGGADLGEETIPRIVAPDSDDPEDEAARQWYPDNDGEPFVAWDNEARVYYTSRISAGQYRSATYTGTLTGAVLRNLLQTAVAYPVRSRRRYQPFAVYRKATNEPLLRSSGDLDFVQALWRHLADVGVELSPLILPNRWQVRLIASDIRRVRVGDDGGDNADPVGFYRRLYNCLDSIATANYSQYSNVQRPGGNRRHRRRTQMEDQFVTSAPSLSGDIFPTVSPAPTALQTLPPLDQDNANQMAQDAAHEAETAAEIAEDAVKRIENATTAHGTHGATEAATNATKAAAEAAKRAANATHTQMASLAQGALLGGDGAAMVQAVAQCFQNPRYGLALSNITAQAYVFWDGAYFYQVNLTTPYIQLVPITSPLPEAVRVSTVNDADFVDYVLALSVLVFSLIGFLLLLQQVMGRNYHVIRPLYKFQRFLFDPMHFNHARTHDGIPLDDEGNDLHRGQGKRHAFALDNIPISMGGLKSLAMYSPVKKASPDDSLSDGWEPGDHTDGLDMEMVASPSGTPRSLSSPDLESPSKSSIVIGSFPHDIPERMLRDPELVDLPTLRSRSKVAVPVAFSASSQNGSTYSDDEG